MKKLIFKLILLFLMFSLSSCFLKDRVNEIMQSWVGHHFSDLVMSWGPPTQVLDNGTGGYILIYTQDVTLYKQQPTSNTYITGTYNSGWLRAHATTYYNPGQTYGYTRYRMFKTDKEGIIISWSWQGL